LVLRIPHSKATELRFHSNLIYTNKTITQTKLKHLQILCHLGVAEAPAEAGSIS